MKSSPVSDLQALDQNRLQKLMLAAPAAAVAAVGGASVAQADIVYFDVNPDPGIGGFSGSFAIGNINLGSGTYTLGSSSGASFSVDYPNIPDKPALNTSGGIIAASSYTSTNYGSIGAVTYFANGATIDGTTVWSGSGINYFDTTDSYGGTFPWRDGNPKTGYVGLRLDAGSGNINYGWAQFSYDDVGDTLTLLDFAFESSLNTAILAGDTGSVIPEPANAALLLAAGAAGVVGFRRRRREAQVA